MKHPRQLQRSEIIAELEKAGATVKGNAIVCPFHNDTHPSGGVFEGRDGVWRFKCQACGFKGDVFDVESRRTGKPLSEVLPKTNQIASQSTIRSKPIRQAEAKTPMSYESLDAIYDYLKRDFGGQLEAVHKYSDSFSMIRWRGSNGKKEMRPVQTTDKGFILKFPDYLPLYRQETLPQAQTVIITEGELKADILSEYGFTVTTSPGGCKAAAKADWQPLAGKDCIIWPDADEPGRGYALAVQAILEPLNCSIRIINPPDLDLQDGEDAADFVKQLQAARNTELEIKQAIIAALIKARDTGGFSALSRRVESMISGAFASLKTGFMVLDKIAPILPGSVTCICSTPGASKSLWLLQLIVGWILSGNKSAVYELEKDVEFHLLRVLAQQAENSNFTDTGWVAGNPNIIREAMDEHRDVIDTASKAITVSPLKAPTQDELASWAKSKAETGHRIIAIDPVSLAVRNGEPYEADSKFMSQLLTIARDYHCFIILICHPVKSTVSFPDMNSMAGGAIYSRAADNIFWLENHDSKESEIRTACGTVPAEHNRTVWVLKSRDGCGTGAKIAYLFIKESLTLAETGLIKTEKGKKK
jgi:hypothetical protein